MTVSDDVLVRRVLDGDPAAFGRLLDRYHDRCVRYATRMLGTREDAEEVCQDAFLRAYRALGRYEPQERFHAWLFRILVNRCRSAAARRRLALETEPSVLERAAAVEQPAEQAALREEILRALDRLDPDSREALLLKYVEDLSYEEISAITGAGVSALKMRVKRACERLRGPLTEVLHAGT